MTDIRESIIRHIAITALREIAGFEESATNADLQELIRDANALRLSRVAAKALEEIMNEAKSDAA